MRPTISVLVPFRGDGAWRDRVWAHLRERWAATGWEVIEGRCPDGPWVKALAVSDAFSRASGDVLAVVDADVWSEGGLGEAVDAVLAGSPWAVPHTEVRRLTRQATEAVLSGGPVQGGLEQRPYRGVAGGGMVVLTREALATVPLDERFAGWGQEDQAWGLALTAVFGQPYRSTEPLWHLWHEPQDRLSRSTGSMSGRLLLRRYQAASGSRDGMLALLADRSTRESESMYRYRNDRTGQEVELPRRNNRLDNLGNWSLISKPAEEELADLLAKVEPTTPTPEPAPVAAPAPIEVDWPDVTPGRDFRPGVEPTEAPEVTTSVAVDPKRPAVNEPKRVWLDYAKTRGIPDAETLTKTALIRACS